MFTPSEVPQYYQLKQLLHVQAQVALIGFASSLKLPMLQQGLLIYI